MRFQGLEIPKMLPYQQQNYMATDTQRHHKLHHASTLDAITRLSYP